MSGNEEVTPGRALAPVGYRNPPVEHRFKAGVSGNPKGRPRKTSSNAQRMAKALFVEDILMAEALRPIQVRENDQIIEMPMIQAVIRGMGVAAVKGSYRAQMALTQMATATQQKFIAAKQDFFETFRTYKTHWLAEFEACDQAGRPRPATIPHPDDVVLDYKRATVTFNGPLSHDEKALWDRMFEIRRASLEDIAEGERLLRERPGRMRKGYEDEVDRLRKQADMIGGIFPDEATRREPGFDLETWRDRKGVLDRLKRESGARKRRIKAHARHG